PMEAQWWWRFWWGKFIPNEDGSESKQTAWTTIRARGRLRPPHGLPGGLSRREGVLGPKEAGDREAGPIVLGQARNLTHPRGLVPDSVSLWQRVAAPS